ncbi:hypothetical protein PHLCEN_2v9777 [Hermanssonia centrifuga]|uniref:Uncharacterized protein n=1 Tax=Hermanssonia centrifuga TaxID=98765 RepID=A0A2R6NPU3_9APHY|nr:hypothetical protein PHLCEN_2v9777 [Hermanssonia centrifuga]
MSCSIWDHTSTTKALFMVRIPSGRGMADWPGGGGSGQSALVGAWDWVFDKSDLQVMPALSLPLGLPFGWPPGLLLEAATVFEAWPAHLAGLPLLGILVL